MKLVGKQGLSGLVEIALVALMVVALGLTISLPWSVEAVTHNTPGAAGYWYEKYLAVLLVSGVLSECILWQARGLMHNVNTGMLFPGHRAAAAGYRLVLPGSGAVLFCSSVCGNPFFHGGGIRSLFRGGHHSFCVCGTVPSGSAL